MTNRQLLQLKKRYIKEGYKKALKEGTVVRQDSSAWGEAERLAQDLADAADSFAKSIKAHMTSYAIEDFRDVSKTVNEIKSFLKRLLIV